MSYFAYLAVELDADARSGEPIDGHVARVAKRHALRFDEVVPRGTLTTFAGDADLVATFRGEPRASLGAFARELLDASDVARVSVGVWSITGALEEASPSAGLWEIRAIDRGALDSVDWERDVVLEIRRAPGDAARRTLRQLALGIDP